MSVPLLVVFVSVFVLVSVLEVPAVAFTDTEAPKPLKPASALTSALLVFSFVELWDFSMDSDSDCVMEFDCDTCLLTVLPPVSEMDVVPELLEHLLL